jgi:uncharacterized SAM-binding protein YcdF (DUF218 family)
MSSIIKSRVNAIGLLSAAALLLALGLLFLGDRILILNEPLPEHADAAVVLQGSMVAENARIAGAMNLLQRNVADRVLLSLPKQSYWGQAIAPIAQAYLQKNYGSDFAARVDFCQTGGEVDSTWQEAQMLSSCIREHGWHSIVIVTSDYHARRSRMIWLKTVRNHSTTRVWIDGVADVEFQRPWWRHRKSAKVWFFEMTKLIWTIFGGK